MKEFNKIRSLKLALLSVLIISFSCKEEKSTYQNWEFKKEIKMEGVNPIGITSFQNNLWISDGDHNRIVEINSDGKVTKSIDSLDRPMHIDANADEIFIPQYGNDKIAVLNGDVFSDLQIKDSLDAPAGISLYENEKAIADFYSHRILFFDGENWISFGKEGKLEGEFYYPTDVQITKDKIFVADAYNNRVQVFDKKGNFLQIIGADQKMNAATGIFVSDISVFVTDFENNRVLVFDFDGNLQQEISENIEKPTDILVYNNELNILNYRKSSINIYRKK